MTNILHLDASGRKDASVSRKLSRKVVDVIAKEGDNISYRDVGDGLSFVDDTMIGSYFTPEDKRDERQKNSVELSNTITQELLDHDILVIGIPIYNFSMPAAFKAWADLAARAGITFKYTDTGPVGLLEGKKAYVVITTGGMKVGSDVDFLTPWLRQYLNFLGIADIEIISAEGLVRNMEDSVAAANKHIESLARVSS